jgi:outer membrane protein TolC
MKALMRSVLPAACAALVTASPIATSAQVDQPTAAPVAPAPASAPAPVAAPAAAETEFDLGAALRSGGEQLDADGASARAVAASVDIAKARATTEQARQAASQAFVAVYPRLDLEASYTRLSVNAPPQVGESESELPSGEIVVTRFSGIQVIPDNYVLQARLTVPVSELFLEGLPRYEAANRLTEVQALREISERESVALRAKQAYYEYARARAAKLIAEAALAQNEAQLRDVQALVRGGALARVEQMRADAQVAASRVALARTQGNVAVAQTALRVILNVEGDGEFAIDEDLTQPLPALQSTKADLRKAALANRSELKAMRAMYEVHDRTLDAENGAKLPKLNLTGLAEFSNPNQRVEPFTREFNGSWQVGAVLSWSPNDFFVADKRANRARADRAVTETDVRLLELALRGEVDQAYEDFVASQEATTQALSGIAAAEETYRVRREQFRAGSVVATEVIQAETELRRARLELVSAAIDARIAAARIARAIEAK